MYHLHRLDNVVNVILIAFNEISTSQLKISFIPDILR